MKLSICLAFIGILIIAHGTVISNDLQNTAQDASAVPSYYGFNPGLLFAGNAFNGFNGFNGFNPFGNSQQTQQNVLPTNGAQNSQIQQNVLPTNGAQNSQTQQNVLQLINQQTNQQQNQQTQPQQPAQQQQTQQIQQQTQQLNQPQFGQQTGQINPQTVQPNLLIPINGNQQTGSNTNQGSCNNGQDTNPIIFDNNIRELCQAPRIWNGVKCVCQNNGVYLSGKCYNQVPQERTRDIFSLRYINRNYDGSENNPNHPEYGAKGSPLLRLTQPNYQDGRSEPLKRIPSPRDVSNIVGDFKNNNIRNNMYNPMFLTWSQFIGNDISYTPTTNQFLNISIPRCDKFFDKACTGKQDLPFARSIYQLKNGIRTSINAVSSWLDASHIYGSDKKTADSLREFKGGKLKLGADALLPKDVNGDFISGDRRVNQNVLLTALQTVFVREHNRICDNVTARNSSFTDEEVYQIARNYVIGLVQRITFDEFLPLMFGRMTFNKYFGNFTYDPEANPSIYSEFQVAGLRVFDSNLGPNFIRMNPNSTLAVATIEWRNLIENPDLINKTSIAQFVSGALRSNIKRKSVELVDDLRHYFITNEFPNQYHDLYSINIQRGRDLGVGSLKDIREALGLPVKNIAQIFVNQPRIDCLESLYQNPDNIDLWVALIGEEPESMTALGEIGNKLWILQMNKIRNGDSLWYEYAYPSDVVKEIKATSLSTLITRHLGNNWLPATPFMTAGMTGLD